MLSKCKYFTLNLCILQLNVVLSRKRSPSTTASEQCNLSQSPPLSRFTPFTIGGSLRLIEQSAAPYSSLQIHVPLKRKGCWQFLSYIDITQTILYPRYSLPFSHIPLWWHSPGHATDNMDSTTETPSFSVSFWNVLFCDSSLKQSAFNPSRDAIAHDVLFVNLIIKVIVSSRCKNHIIIFGIEKRHRYLYISDAISNSIFWSYIWDPKTCSVTSWFIHIVDAKWFSFIFCPKYFSFIECRTLQYTEHNESMFWNHYHSFHFDHRST